MSGVEYSDGRGPGMAAMRSLADAAGMTLAELRDDYAMGGVAALRRAAELARNRRRDPRRALVALLGRVSP